MIRTALLCAAAIVLATSVAIAQATLEPQPITAWHFVGFSTNAVQGDVGINGMKAQCQADFPTSRMCSSAEVVSGVWTSGESSTATAWVQPVRGSSPGMDDPSGRSDTAVASLNCRAWSYAPNGSGLTVDSSGAFYIDLCSEHRPVACCIYATLVPEPNQSSLLASGVILLVMLRRRRLGDQR